MSDIGMFLGGVIFSALGIWMLSKKQLKKEKDFKKSLCEKCRVKYLNFLVTQND